MASVLNYSLSILLARCMQLIAEFEKKNSTLQGVLRLFYKMAIFDQDFDTALIEFLKQATGNYIRKHADSKLDQGMTIKELIEQTNKLSVMKFIQEIVYKNEEDPHTIIFNIIPLVMRVNLQLIEYPHPSEDNKSPYNSMNKFHLDDALNFHNETIKLLRTDKLIYDILYNESDIKRSPEFLSYDENIDAKPTSDIDQILSPICCKQGYYLPGYLRTMLKKRKEISKICVACGGKLDDLSYKKLKDAEPGWPYTKIIITGLSLVSFIASTLFLIDHIIFF